MPTHLSLEPSVGSGHDSMRGLFRGHTPDRLTLETFSIIPSIPSSSAYLLQRVCRFFFYLLTEPDLSTHTTASRLSKRAFADKLHRSTIPAFGSAGLSISGPVLNDAFLNQPWMNLPVIFAVASLMRCNRSGMVWGLNFRTYRLMKLFAYSVGLNHEL